MSAISRQGHTPGHDGFDLFFRGNISLFRKHSHEIKQISIHIQTISLGRFDDAHDCCTCFCTSCDSLIEATNQHHFSGSIYGYEGSTVQSYAEKYGITFVPVDSVSVKGDVNADGAFNVADAVALQKWLLAVPDTHLANWEAADMCEDERLDVFDLCLIKRELLKNN